MENKTTCSQCGATITTEICPYCGSKTEIDTKNADMIYPIIDCKEANIGFWTVAFPGLFAFIFGGFGLFMPLIFYGSDPYMDFSEKAMMAMFAVIFGGIGITAFIIMIRPIVNWIFIKIKGKKITGTVYGYVNDSVVMNGEPAQIAKILVQTKNGPHFLFYQLGHPNKPYRINKQITLLMYKNKFLIAKDEN